MIVIVGDTHDDVLYFETVLANKKEEIIMNRYKISVGTIFSQGVIVLHEMSTSILLSAVLTYVLNNYYVDLVINVGKCMSGSERAKPGDIALASEIIDANVDLSIFKDVGMSQIPGFSREFSVQDDIYHYLAQALESRPNIDYHRSIYLSSDNMSLDIIEHLRSHKEMFSKNGDCFVIDHNSSGVAVACALKSTPFVVAKVIENDVDHTQNLKTYSNVLKRYIDLGKAVILTINNIGRSDILEGGE